MAITVELGDLGPHRSSKFGVRTHPIKGGERSPRLAAAAYRRRGAESDVPAARQRSGA